MDPTIPMWVLKIKGNTYYIDHLEANLPFSTKETPDNPSTKGSIKFKKVHVIIDDENCATLRSATALDMQEQKERDKPPIRVITQNIEEIKTIIKNNKIQHDPIKIIEGSCNEDYYVFDLKTERDLSMLLMSSNSSVRRLKSNEHFYEEYTE